ncbi:alpha-L-fucosidase [Streptomyces sp. NPDC127079]|uniref:alpha-L-fucosidase n=1 Tax=Streptomyces sp. NPDC127079 TaxID=3347132 RepID=UPI00364ABC08
MWSKVDYQNHVTKGVQSDALQRDPDWWTLADWWTQPDGVDPYNWLTSKWPNVVINERVKRDFGLGAYAVAEFGIPSAPMDRPWEYCATVNGAWGYNASQEASYRSRANDGHVTQGAQNILGGLAAWMGTYSDSVHGTSGSPFATEPSWGRCTKKHGKLFAHVFSWPTGGTLRIPAVSNTINRVHLMNNPLASLSYTVSGGQINVQIRSTAPDANDSVVCVEVSGMPTVLANGVYRLSNGSGRLGGAHRRCRTDGRLPTGTRVSAVAWPSSRRSRCSSHTRPTRS